MDKSYDVLCINFLLPGIANMTGPRFTKNLKSDRNRKPISEAKMRSTKYNNFLTTSVFERK